MEIKECREEEDKLKIYTGSATNRAYIQSLSNLRFLRFLSTLNKPYQAKDPQGMYPPLFSLNNQVDVPSSWTDPQWDIPSLVLSITTQVDVPSTCTTKDVPSNVLRQSS